MPHLRVAAVASTVAAAHAALQKPQKCSIAAASIARPVFVLLDLLLRGEA
jgi:hypothetical protein